MQDELTRAERYLQLAAQMVETAEYEPDEKRRRELVDLADQYQRLADRLIEKQRGRAGPL
ncbi:MAG TPA: hypothetical protein VGF97_05350 [Rhizomicrobium sp.]|jgi:hypothetical protein